MMKDRPYSLQWHHNGCDGISNHEPHHCLLNCLFRCRSKKISKFRVNGLFAGNSPVTGEFLSQMASNVIMITPQFSLQMSVILVTRDTHGFPLSHCQTSVYWAIHIWLCSLYEKRTNKMAGWHHNRHKTITKFYFVSYFPGGFQRHQCTVGKLLSSLISATCTTSNVKIVMKCSSV